MHPQNVWWSTRSYTVKMNVYNQDESQTYQVKARIITTKEYNVVKR